MKNIMKVSHIIKQSYYMIHLYICIFSICMKKMKAAHIRESNTHVDCDIINNCQLMEPA